MSSLLLQHEGVTRAGTLHGRVIIGRWSTAQIRADHPAISRLHAWISQRPEGGWFVSDAGSRTGTFVNGRRIRGAHDLRYGDAIRIGPLQMRLVSDIDRPVEAAELDLSPRPPLPPSKEAGIMTDCVCGAPIWAAWEFAGRQGACRHCGRNLTITVPEQIAPATQTAPAGVSTPLSCGVCHGQIEPNEESVRCGDCHTPYHRECWTENYGCGSYGCSQVNALKPKTADAATPVSLTPELVLSAASAAKPAQVELLLLAGSVLSVLVGALAFGVPALVVGGVACLYLARASTQRRAIVILAAVFAILGGLAGALTSYAWWIGFAAHAR